MIGRYTATQANAILDMVDQCKLVVQKAAQAVQSKDVASQLEAEKRVYWFYFDQAIDAGVDFHDLTCISLDALGDTRVVREHSAA